MKKGDGFSIASRIQSFVNAFRGLKDMILTEHNAWIHLTATIIALGLGWFFQIDPIQWISLIIAIVIVWIAEVFNTVLEIMADLVVGERYSRMVKRAKDIAAAAVLIASIGALSTGLIIFVPILYAWSNRG